MALSAFTFKGAVHKPDGWWPWYHFTEDANLAINSNFSLTVRTDEELEMDSNKLVIHPADEAEAWAVGGALLSVIIYTYSYSLW